MDSAPRLNMINFYTKSISGGNDFPSVFRQFILSAYGEDPDKYAAEIEEFAKLHELVRNVPTDFMGCALLKKYYGQLLYLQGRFPMGLNQAASVTFRWRDCYGEAIVELDDINFELANVLFNIGAIHSSLGAMDSRVNTDGMKVSCTHFQCAAWAFDHLRDKFDTSMSEDFHPDLLRFKHTVMLAQAQECILEKSMVDGRKSTITAKIAVQLVSYYKQALELLSNKKVQTLLGRIMSYKDMKNLIVTKIAYYDAVTFLYLGLQSAEQDRYGEIITYFQAALDKATEAAKSAKNETYEDVRVAVDYLKDLLTTKHEKAKKDNDFVYHEKIPTLESLHYETKGASLVKGVPFNPRDPEVTGPDIFARLIPMKAHEASSLYSEEKAQLLRQIDSEVQIKNEEMRQFLDSLVISRDKLNEDPNVLPEKFMECCARASSKPEIVRNLTKLTTEMELALEEILRLICECDRLIDEQIASQHSFHEKFGSHLVDEKRFAELTSEGKSRHKDADDLVASVRAQLDHQIKQHAERLKALSTPRETLESKIPVVECFNRDEYKKIVADLIRLHDKVGAMESQRKQLHAELRQSIVNDDITGRLASTDTETESGVSDMFKVELDKHKPQLDILRQNLSAQSNIFNALLETNAQLVAYTIEHQEELSRRQTIIEDMINAWEMRDTIYQQVVDRSRVVERFKTDLSGFVDQIKATCRSFSLLKENHEKLYRDKPVEKPINPTPPAIDRGSRFVPQLQPSVTTVAPTPAVQTTTFTPQAAALDITAIRPSGTGLKLKDFLPYMKPKTFGPGSKLGLTTTAAPIPVSPAQPQFTNASASFGSGVIVSDGSAVTSNLAQTEPTINQQFATPPPRLAYPNQPPTNTPPVQSGYNPLQFQSQPIEPSPNVHPVNPCQPFQMPQPNATHHSVHTPDIKAQNIHHPSTVTNIASITAQSYPSVMQQPSSQGTYLSPQGAYPPFTYVSANQPVHANTAISGSAMPVASTAQFAHGFPVADYSQSNTAVPVQQNITMPNQSFRPPVASNIPGQYSQAQGTLPVAAPQPQTSTVIQQSQIPSQQFQCDSGVSTHPGPSMDHGVGIMSSNCSAFASSNISHLSQPQFAQPSMISSPHFPQQLQQSTSLASTSPYAQNIPAPVATTTLSSNGYTRPQPAVHATATINRPTYPISSTFNSSPHYNITMHPRSSAQNYTMSTGDVTCHQSQISGQCIANNPQPQFVQPQNAVQPLNYNATTQIRSQSTSYSQLPQTQTFSSVSCPSQTHPIMRPNQVLDVIGQTDSLNGLVPPLCPSSRDTQAPVPEPILKPTPILKSTPGFGENISGHSMTSIKSPAGIRTSRTPLPVPQAPLSPTKQWKKINAENVYSNEELLKKFAADVEKFDKYVEGLHKQTLDGWIPIDKYWKEITDEADNDTRTFSMAVGRCYPLRNRNPDIMPFDKNRVVISCLKDDYINASRLAELSDCVPDFIVCQAPLPNERSEFWHMVFEQGIELIVAVLADSEIESLKCSYWPEKRTDPVVYGDLTITVQTEKVSNDWRIRVVNIHNKASHQTRSVIQLQFFSWLHQMLPNSPRNLLNFIAEVHVYFKQQRSLLKPVLVHCSDGTGRSGGFVAIYAAVCSINTGAGIPQIRQLIGKLLLNRRRLIDTRQLFMFIHTAVLYHSTDILMKRGILVRRASFDDEGVRNAGTGSTAAAVSVSSKPSTHHELCQVETDIIKNAIKKTSVHSSPSKAVTTERSATECTTKRSATESTATAEAYSSVLETRIVPQPKVAETGTTGIPQPATTLSDSLSTVQNPDLFTLEMNEDSARRRITKADFAVGSTMASSKFDPLDPLAQLNPLWAVSDSSRK